MATSTPVSAEQRAEQRRAATCGSPPITSRSARPGLIAIVVRIPP